MDASANYEDIAMTVRSGLSLMSSVATAIEEQVKRIEHTISHRLEELAAKTAELEQRKQRMLAVAADKKSIVRFNVGGRVFAVSKKDLLAYDDSFFFYLLGSDDWLPGSDGTYFIDMDPRHFHVVLDYMRGETIDLRSYNDTDVTEIEQLLVYFNLPCEPIAAVLSAPGRKRRTRSEGSDDPSLPLASATPAEFANWVRSKVTDSLAMVAKAESSVETALTEIRVREEQAARLERLVRAHAETEASKVTIDVGGELFATTRANLLRFPNSYFSAMLGSGTWRPEERGAYFVNKNPRDFDIVMQYMRSGSFRHEGLHHAHLERISELLQYLQLTVPRPQLTWDAAKCGPYLELRDGYRCVSRQRLYGSWDFVTAVLGSESVTRFSVKLSKHLLVPSTRALIGFASREAFDLNGKNSLNGWYLDLNNGTLISRSTYNKPYTSAFGAVEVLTAVHDTHRNEVTFERDGKSLGVAFADIPRDKLFPALDLCCGCDDDLAGDSDEDDGAQDQHLPLLAFT
jgi:hypothetical protein